MSSRRNWQRLNGRAKSPDRPQRLFRKTEGDEPIAAYGDYRHPLDEDGKKQYLHRGIATRSFERRFQLADFIEAGNATFENGLLSIELKRVVPEAMKPRRIEIGGSKPAPDQIEGPKEKAHEAA